MLYQAVRSCTVSICSIKPAFSVMYAYTDRHAQQKKLRRQIKEKRLLGTGNECYGYVAKWTRLNDSVIWHLEKQIINGTKEDEKFLKEKRNLFFLDTLWYRVKELALVQNSTIFNLVLFGMFYFWLQDKECFLSRLLRNIEDRLKVKALLSC